MLHMPSAGVKDQPITVFQSNKKNQLDQLPSGPSQSHCNLFLVISSENLTNTHSIHNYKKNDN